MQVNNSFLSLENVNVRSLNQAIFTDLDFRVNQGESWALVGESGSGKSALLQTLYGNLNVTNGSVCYYFYANYIKEQVIDDPLFNSHHLIGYVPQKHSFKNLSNTSQFYYQQRYNSFDSEDAPTVKSHLSKIDVNLGINSYWTLEHTIERFNLKNLLDKELIKLSNGETKRLLIASALLKKPLLLLLDNPFTGLDVETRPVLHEVINEIIESGITVIMATSPKEIPELITHVAVLQEGKIINSLAKDLFSPSMVKIKEVKQPDRDELYSLLSLNALPYFTNIVKMKSVSIKYGDTQILSKIDWCIKQGERWALVGPNGAGKSTLLSLINGDNPQAYSNDIILFDRKRGSGESIWDIKRNIGFVSPELFQYFKSGSTCIEIVESGFYDTLGLFRKSSRENSAVAQRWMKVLEIEESTHQPFNKVPASIQRLCLLARALVKDPPLLILDEPCQGLDEHQQEYFKRIVDTITALRNITLIYVTHYQEELPDCINKVFKLEKGEQVSS